MPNRDPVFLPADILLPGEETDLSRWAVLACDQFTSQPDYWQKADTLVADAPSTLRITLPEVYLEEPDIDGRIAAIHLAMADYRAGVLSRQVPGFVYLERQTSTGVRQGLVGCVDLEAYSYQPDTAPRIRPSEGTLVERIPPRLAVRRGAVLESPHILMLIDDPDARVIEPLGSMKDQLTMLYDTQLMLGGGRLQGWAVQGEPEIFAVQAAIAALEDAERFRSCYGVGEDETPFALAVGDGNHSLATAKAAWEEMKPGLDEKMRKAHPARYCLVELINVQSPAVDIEPIHRVVFGAGDDIKTFAEKFAEEAGGKIVPDGQGEQAFTVLRAGRESTVSLLNPWRPLAAGAVDAILDSYLQSHPGARVDYVHGEDAVRQLVAGQDAVGILLPTLKKSDLFRGVALGGVLPRKTFSMGHATDKRYYMECRAIV
ncbi:MAG: DUF1015 domain-containing protein [Ruminococcaceae bacterium]|nr:DUF1015 domain-containing protein [Oscillospiraceae bacterium]